MRRIALVERSAGNMVDFNRASLIMDREIIGMAIFEAMAAYDNPVDDYSLQAVWEHYCKLHKEKYGNPFKPDISGDWY